VALRGMARSMIRPHITILQFILGLLSSRQLSHMLSASNSSPKHFAATAESLAKQDSQNSPSAQAPPGKKSLSGSSLTANNPGSTHTIDMSSWRTRAYHRTGKLRYADAKDDNGPTASPAASGIFSAFLPFN